MVIKNIGIPKSFPIGNGIVVHIPTGESTDHPSSAELVKYVNTHPDLSVVEAVVEKPATPKPAPVESKRKSKKSKEKAEEPEPEKVEEEKPTEDSEPTEG